MNKWAYGCKNTNKNGQMGVLTGARVNGLIRATLISFAKEGLFL